MTGIDSTIRARRVAVTGSTHVARGVVGAMVAAGAAVAEVACDFTSEVGVGEGLAAAEKALGGLDQVVHAWVPASLLEAVGFNDLDEQSWAAGCEAALEGAWWLARQAIPPLVRTGGTLVFLIPTVGLSGAAGYSMLSAWAEGVRVLAKGCGRQLGKDGVTVNAIATAPHLWVGAAEGEVLSRATSLSTPALGGPGDAGADIAPLVALLGEPGAHFLTAGTLVADGGVWMGF